MKSTQHVWRMFCRTGFAFMVLATLLSGISTARAFNHPGIFSTLSDLDYVKTNLNNEPWHSAFVALTNNSYASLTYQMQGPFGVVARDTGVSTNLSQWQNDITAAYEQSVLWYLTGNQTYANNAINIYNAWSGTLTNFGGNNAQLGANTVYIACAGAEILRYTGAGWSAAGIGQFQGMLTNVFVPVCAPYGVANWGTGAIQAMMAMGIFCDDPDLFNSAMAEFQTATYYPPNRDSGIEYISQSGQNQESGRDQVHTIMGMEALAGCAEMLYDQGYDGWGYGGNRILAGYEYWSKYNLGYNNLPFDLGIYSNESPWSGMSATSRGINGSLNNYNGVDSGSVMVQRAYARKGIGMRYTTEVNNLVRPYKNLGWGNLTALDTLLFSYAPTTSPALPADVFGNLTDADIGNPIKSGSATYTSATTNWTVVGGGANIWGTNDQFNFVNTNIGISSTIATYVSSFSGPSSGSMAGVMLRETLAANSAMGLVDVTPGKGVQFIYRTAAGGSCSSASVSGITAPCWVKLVGSSTSAGGPFQYMTAFYSKDGVNWSVVGQIMQFTMGTNVYAGLAVSAVTSGSSTATANFQFTSLGASPINTPTTAPAAPAGLTATAQSLGQVALSWNAVSGATSYNIYSSPTSGGPYLTAIYGVTNTSCVLGQMLPNTTYYYTVTALNSAGGESGYSMEASVTPTVPVVTGTTITLSSTQPMVGSASIAQLDYSGGVHSGNNYTDHGVAESFTTGGNATGYDLTALVFKGASSTSATSGQRLTVRVNKLDGPTGMMPVAMTTANWSFTQNDASWVTIALGSPVHLDPNTVYEFDVRETGPSGTWYGLAVGTNLPAGPNYYYSMPPYTGGWGSFLGMSTTNLATLYFSPHGYNQTFIAQMTASAGAGPSAPTSLNAAGGNLVANLNWTQSTSPGITGNNVYRSTSGNGGPYNLLASLAATTSYSDTTVSAGSTYYYSVTAVNGNGESAMSAYAGTITVPPVPTGLTATAGNGQVALTWNAASGASSYNIKRATVSGGPYTTIASGVTATSYTDTTAVNGTTYYYVVSAVNSAGESANSTEVGAQPVSPSGNAAVLSINFQGGSSANGTPSPMATTESAGQVTANNWNNAPGVSGTVSSLVQGDGTSTAASVSWSCNNTWSTPITESPGDYRMMKGYLDTSASSTTSVSISGLPSAYTTNGYSVYVYCDGDNGTTAKAGAYTIGGMTINATDNGGVNFAGAYVQANNSSGNYVVFSNLTASAFTLQATPSNSRAPVNGIQIVAKVSTGVPSAPTGLTAVAGRRLITLAWTQSASGNITANNVYRSTVNGGPYSLVASIAATISYVDSGLSKGTTYYYVVTAVNSGGSESPDSNQATAKSN